MAHKPKNNKNTESSSYTIGDAIKIADDIFELSKEKKYNLGAFVHGMIFALEYAQSSYNIPQQQMALIKRDCRKYFKNIDNIKQQKS
jgi:hypothetical protein